MWKNISRLAAVVGIALVLTVFALSSGNAGIRPASATVVPVGGGPTISATTCILPWGHWVSPPPRCYVKATFEPDFTHGFTLPAHTELLVGRGSGVETDGATTVGTGAAIFVSDGGTFSIETTGTAVTVAGSINVVGPDSFLTIAAGTKLSFSSGSTFKVLESSSASVAGALTIGGTMGINSYSIVTVLGGGVLTNNGILSMGTDATLQILPSGNYTDSSSGTASIGPATVSDMGLYNEEGTTTLTSYSYVAVINGGTLTLTGTLKLTNHAELYIDNLGSTASSTGTIAGVGTDWLITNDQGGCIGGVVPGAGAQWGFTPAADQC